MTSDIDGKVTNAKKSAKFHHSHWRFHYVQFEAAETEIFPFLTTAIKCQEVSSIPSFRAWETHPNLACCERWTKKTWESLLPFSAAWQVSWLKTISSLKFPLCYWRLHFHLLKYNRISSMIFSFPVWCNLFFQPIFSSQNKNWSVMRPDP